MVMTNRERVLAVLDGKLPDRIPWIPQTMLWYKARIREGNMPARFQGMSEQEVGRALRVGRKVNNARMHRTRVSGLEVEVRKEPHLQLTTFITPYGRLVERVVYPDGLAGEHGTTTSDRLVERATGGYFAEHLISKAEDFRLWEYVVEHTHYEPAYEEFLDAEARLGEDGYPYWRAGDCPFHYFCTDLAGYNDAFYLMADYPQQFEHLMAVMTQVEKERLWPVLAGSPGRLIRHGTHFDSQMTPPHFFRQYITPYYQELSALLHARGKKLAHHADDDCKLILREIKEAGFDMSESFCTAPMVRVTLEEARLAWGKDVIIWGGIPAVLLEETFPEEEFRQYVKNVFRTIAPGDAFILGVADNVMPTSIIERVEWISDFVEEYGQCPIDPAKIP